MAAGLLGSFIAILDVDPGENIQHVLTARVNLPPDNTSAIRTTLVLRAALIQQVSVLPSVREAGLVSDLPLTGENNDNPATAATAHPSCQPVGHDELSNGEQELFQNRSISSKR